MTSILLALAIGLFAAEVPPPVKGRVCIAERKIALTDGRCSDVSGMSFAVTPADHWRFFVWTDADAKSAQLGVVPAKAAELKLDSDDRRELKLSVRGDASRGWPADTKISVRSSDQWEWTIPARAIARLERLYVPAGSYELTARAERHHAIRRTSLNVGKDTNIGTLTLTPLTIVRGRVAKADDKPAANAVITFPDASICTTADEQGAFRCELREPQAEVLIVGAPGFGSRELILGRGVNTPEHDAGVIRLAKARVLTLKMTRPRTETVRVTLFKDSPDVYEHSRVGAREMAPGDDEVRFENAGEGKYMVLFEGQQPLERLEVPVEIGTDDVTREVSIVPFLLQGTVTFGGDSLKEGRITLVSAKRTWRHALNIVDGSFGGTIWQPGVMKAFVSAKEASAADLITSPTLGDDPSRWDVQIAKRLIAGHIVDAASKGHVDKASMNIVAKLRDGSAYMTGRIQPDGTFQILASPIGVYRLTVSAPGYISSIEEVPVTAEDTVKKVEIALERGVAQELEIVSAAGAPVPNAWLLEGVQPDNRYNPIFMAHADAAGKFSLRGRPGEVRVISIVPQDGSFAIVRLQIPRTSEQSKPLQVVIPAPSATLRLRTIDKDEKPVPAQVLIRYNGEFLPGAMARFVTNTLPGTDRTGEGLLTRYPAGSYELWALAGREDEERLIASGGTLRSPTRVGLTSGEQSVTLTAPPREKR